MHSYALSPTLCFGMNVSQSHSKGHTKDFPFPPAYNNIPPRGESKFMHNLYTFMHSSPLLSTAQDEDRKLRNVIARVTLKVFPFQPLFFLWGGAVSLYIIYVQ